MAVLRDPATPRITLASEQTEYVLDLRGRHLPELPEAQARLGMSVICDGLPDRDGRRKVNCMGSAQHCREFLSQIVRFGCDPASGYGDPMRGIVGAYTQEPTP